MKRIDKETVQRERKIGRAREMRETRESGDERSKALEFDQQLLLLRAFLPGRKSWRPSDQSKQQRN